MKRLQLWKIKSKPKEQKPERCLPENGIDTRQGADERQASILGLPENKNRTEDTKGEELKSRVLSKSDSTDKQEEANDPDASPSSSYQRRNSDLSFETFRKPQSKPNPNLEDDQSLVVKDKDTAVSSNEDPPFEVIYRQVNKGKLVPQGGSADQDPTKQASGTHNAGAEKHTDKPLIAQDPPGNKDLSVLSFDDVLESFRISLNDLEALGSVGATDKQTLAMDVDLVKDIVDGNAPAIYADGSPEVEVITTEDPFVFSDAGDTMVTNNPIDLDLMMSDEVIVRPRKKSVTFSEKIQERPLSMGESDVTVEDPADPETRPKAYLIDVNPGKDNDEISQSDVQTAGNDRPVNGTLKSQNGTAIPSNGTSPNGIHTSLTDISQDHSTEQSRSNPDDPDDTSHFESDQNTQIQNKNRVTDTPWEDDELSVTSFDLSDEEEELLKIKPPKVRHLPITRSVLLVFMWICLVWMTDAVTTSFPLTQTRLNVTIDVLARAHVSRGTGCLFAAIVTAIVCTHTSCDLFVWLVFGLVVVIGSLLWLPWCDSMITTASSYGISGLGEFVVLSGGIMLVTKLWDTRRRNRVIHILFIAQALASALLPQVTHHLTQVTANWTISGLSVESHIVDSARPTGIPDLATIATTYAEGHAFIKVVQFDIPERLPVYLALALSAALCVVFTCILLGYKQCQVSRRKEMERKVKHVRKRLLKRQIQLVGNNDPRRSTDVTQGAGTYFTAGTTADPESTKSSVDTQVAKLLEYARHLENSPLDDGPLIRKTLSSDKNNWLLGAQTFGISTQMFLYVFFTLAGGLTMTFSQFLYVYSYHHMAKGSGSENDLLFTVFWGSIAVSRLVAFPVSHLLSPNAIMITCLVTNMSSSAVMIAYADKYPVLLWLFGGLIGASVGPIIPGGFTWANIYYNMNAPKSVGLMFAFLGVGMMLFPWCCGFVVHSWGVPAMFYMTLTTSALAAFLYIPVLVTHSKHRTFIPSYKRPGSQGAQVRTYL